VICGEVLEHLNQRYDCGLVARGSKIAYVYGNRNDQEKEKRRDDDKEVTL
jgi:hypothetical protein